MNKILILFVSLVSFVKICNGQVDTHAKEFYNIEFKWRISIPSNFESTTTEQYEKLRQAGTAVLGDGTKIEAQGTKVFSFKSGQLNDFEASQQPENSKTEDEFVLNCKKVSDLLFNSFKKQVPGDTKLDSAISKEKIDGLTFQLFKVQMTFANKNELNVMIYNGLFSNKELTVAIMYLDKDKGDLLLNAWRNSKFDKN